MKTNGNTPGNQKRKARAMRPAFPMPTINPEHCGPTEVSRAMTGRWPWPGFTGVRADS